MNARKGFSKRWQDLHPVRSPEGKPGPESVSAQPGMLKSVLILTTLLFLVVAPEPDSNDIAEMTSYFLVPVTQSGLLASAEPVSTIKEESAR